MSRALLLTALFAVLLTAPFVTIPKTNGGLWLYLVLIWTAMLCILAVISRKLKTGK